MAKVPTILERLQTVEKIQDQIWRLFEMNFGELRKSLAQYGETIQAVAESQGPEFKAKVDAKLKEVRVARYEAERGRNDQLLNQLLENNVLEASDTIAPESVITGRYFDKAGELTEPGYAQMEFQHANEAVKTKLLGKGPGSVYTFPEVGQTFEVTGVYKYVKKTEAALAEAVVAASAVEPVATPAEATPVVAVETPAAPVAETTQQ